MSVAEVGSRIAAITSRLAELSPPVPSSASTSAAPDFATSLAAASSTRRASDLPSWSRSGDLGSQALAAGTKYLGVPYRWGGTDPATGLDCSALVQHAYEDVGVTLPRVARDQAKAGTAVASLDEARPGDLIAFGEPVDHIALYAGDGKILQAPHTGDVVKISEIHRPIVAIRRVMVPTAPTLTSPVLSGGVSRMTDTEAARLDRFSALFASAAKAYDLPAGLLRAVAKVESSGRTDETSRAGARGLMQLMPSTARSLGVDPSDPAQAIDGAARYLRSQLDAFGSVDLAVAAYNAGPGAVHRAGGVPAFAETQAYVRKVMAQLR